MKLPGDQTRAVSALSVTPERQFLNYAWPCLGNRTGHGQQVLPFHVNEIVEVLHRDASPRRTLLRFVFPEAFRGIGQAALYLGVPRWSHPAIERYFLVDHDRHLDAAVAKGVPARIVGLCRVFVGQVCSLDPLACDPLSVGHGRVTVLNPLRIPVQVGTAVAVHGRIVVDVLRASLFRVGIMRLNELFVSAGAVRALVRNVLQCQCPDAVFDDIRIGCPTLYSTHSTPSGLEVLVGRRLLVTIVSCSDLQDAETDIHGILEAGRRTRDEQGFNRFRLVVVGVLSAEFRSRMGSLSAALQERVHLHLLDEQDLMRCAAHT